MSLARLQLKHQHWSRVSGPSCSIAKYKMCPGWTFRFCVCTAWSVSTHVLMIVCFISAISRWWYGISFCLKLWQNKRLEEKMRTRCYWSQGVHSFHLDVVQFNNTCHRKSTCASVTGLTVFFFFPKSCRPSQDLYSLSDSVLDDILCSQTKNSFPFRVSETLINPEQY